MWEGGRVGGRGRKEVEDDEEYYCYIITPGAGHKTAWHIRNCPDICRSRCHTGTGPCPAYCTL